MVRESNKKQMSQSYHRSTEKTAEGRSAVKRDHFEILPLPFFSDLVIDLADFTEPFAEILSDFEERVSFLSAFSLLADASLDTPFELVPLLFASFSASRPATSNTAQWRTQGVTVDCLSWKSWLTFF